MDRIINLKNGILITIIAVGEELGLILGGYNSILIALICCMIIDYICSLIVTFVIKNSFETEKREAQNKVGLARKVLILLIIIMVNQIDIVLGSSGFLRNAVMIGFMANECLSIVEKVGQTGIDLPPVVKNAIDVLKKKSEINQNDKKD
ncbi:phage holin family protein [Clostridium sp. 'White wine YQ']|uniref:phage holin family protein n=1 Tax=Clostridium sp. 'White wine YQ' TaxID=3027474 RepID=UPI00236672E7|nr:phage holin family protein [Clostridium sp. 'White wine YQ']MDD7794833.1 phage holin family protein [Clostridium sp. 'White wine YQ']